MWILCKVVNANWNWLPSPLRNVVPHVVGLVFLSRVVAKENCGYFFFFLSSNGHENNVVFNFVVFPYLSGKSMTQKNTFSKKKK